MAMTSEQKQFNKLLFEDFGNSMQAVSDFCLEHGEPELAEFFDKKNGDGLRGAVERALDVVDPAFLG